MPLASFDVEDNSTKHHINAIRRFVILVIEILLRIAMSTEKVPENPQCLLISITASALWN